MTYEERIEWAALISADGEPVTHADRCIAKAYVAAFLGDDEVYVKRTTWDFTCNSELTEGHCDVCEMDDTVDYGDVCVKRVVPLSDGNPC